MTPEDRRAFAHRLKQERLARFRGNKQATALAAGVNPMTWERAETGLSIKDHSVAKIVSGLWPEADGDWTRIPDQTGTTPARYADLEERVAELERLVAALTSPNTTSQKDHS